MHPFGRVAGVADASVRAGGGVADASVRAGGGVADAACCVPTRALVCGADACEGLGIVFEDGLACGTHLIETADRRGGGGLMQRLGLLACFGGDSTHRSDEGIEIAF